VLEWERDHNLSHRVVKAVVDSDRIGNVASMTKLPLFVFGTLRFGRYNHHLIRGRYKKVLKARLPGYARTEPLMIAEKEDGLVFGELYFLRDEQYAETIRACDSLEGIAAGRIAGPEYRRVRVTVNTNGGKHDAWVYVDAESPAE